MVPDEHATARIGHPAGRTTAINNTRWCGAGSKSPARPLSSRSSPLRTPTKLAACPRSPAKPSGNPVAGRQISGRSATRPRLATLKHGFGGLGDLAVATKDQVAPERAGEPAIMGHRDHRALELRK